MVVLTVVFSNCFTKEDKSAGGFPVLSSNISWLVIGVCCFCDGVTLVTLCILTLLLYCGLVSQYRGGVLLAILCLLMCVFVASVLYWRW
jgi:hypothetical protein